MKLPKITGLAFIVSIVLCGLLPNGVSQAESQSGAGQIRSSAASPIYRSRGQLHRKIRALLASMADTQGDTKVSLPVSLTEIIVINQPVSGNFLLSLIAHPQDKLHRRAVNAFVQSWDTMNVQQVDTYFQRAIELEVNHRERYPQRSGAAIEMGYAVAYGWGGWPAQSQLELKTLTHHFVDDKPYAHATSYKGPMATTGWIHINDLSRGKHTAHLLLEYEFTHQGVRYQGRLKSKKFGFYVVDARTPDDLMAPPSRELEATARAAFHVAETWGGLESQLPSGVSFGSSFGLRSWEPQMSGRAASGEVYELHVPFWGVAPELPVDLFFDVEIHDLSTGKVFEGDPVEVRRGEKRVGYFAPDSRGDFAVGRSGFVPVKIVLKPSRARALSRTWTTRYYPGILIFEGLRAKVGDEPTGPPESIVK
ncbi:MAG: hypothetical protein M3347_04410 [Armatimonadota bacterium]|nr:hypothetical protein [Armatimonadota bacterium]